MADIFTEVDEDLRQERAASLFRRTWPWMLAGLGVALLAWLAVWGWSAWSRAQDARAGSAYAKALDALAAGKLDEADRGFGQAAKAGSSGYRALSLMQQAGVRVTRNRPAEAVGLLDEAAKSTRDPIVRDAALLEAAMAALDTAPLVQSRQRLEPLTAAGRPFRDLAREALAMARLQAGQAKEARADLSTLVIQPDVSEGTRSRARAAVALIDGGGAPQLPAALKAELAMPPAPVGLSAASLAARSGAQ